VVKTLAVTENGYGLYALNELEFIKGYIYANVWMTSRIVKIDPSSGFVVAALDLKSLTDKVLQHNRNLNELNGIAYDSITDRLLVTGKLWPEFYEIKILQ
jgi:glutamine cyclotransferase